MSKPKELAARAVAQLQVSLLQVAAAAAEQSDAALESRPIHPSMEITAAHWDAIVEAYAQETHRQAMARAVAAEIVTASKAQQRRLCRLVGGYEHQGRLFLPGLEEFAARNKPERGKTYHRSIGKGQWRTAPAKLEIHDEQAALRYMAEHGLQPLRQVSYRIDKVALMAHIKKTGEQIPGVAFITDREDLFSISVDGRGGDDEQE
jgi:hypothetical protein